MGEDKEYRGCNLCTYELEDTNGEHCKNCIHNRNVHEDNFKPKTNADKIRNFSDEELADFLHNIGSYVEDGEPLIDIFVGEEKTTISDNFGSIKEWLQSEVKEGE